MPPEQPQGPQKKFSPLMIGAAVIGVAIVVYFIMSAVSSPSNPENANLPPGSEGTIAPSKATQEAQLLEEVYSYVGVVTAVDGTSIGVSAPANKNASSQDKQLVVHTDEHTVLSKITVSGTMKETLTPAELAALISRDTITTGQIKVGDDITVVSIENVAHVNEFTASRVDVRVVE